MSLTTLLVDARPVDHPTARQRGIGRWVTGLLTGLRDIDAPVIALYGNDDEAEVLADTIPGLRTQRWCPQVVRNHAVDGTWYLATQLMLHPIPLDPIPRCVTAAGLPVAAVMYDVIPYRHPDVYFAQPNARRQAELRAPLARTVDTMLSISDFAGTTAAAELRFPLDHIHTIGAGVDAMFRPPIGDPRPTTARVIPADVGPYVVSVAGRDDHKNVQGLMLAWALAERTLAGSHRLVVAGAHDAALLARWRRWADDAGVTDRVIYTGRLDDDELVAVLQGADLAVTPSLEEGFGLPVLEAAACGTAAIASNVSSLPEVLDEPAAGFDPHDPRSIADAIVRALTDDDHRAVLLAAGRRAVERWTWTNVATAAVEALDGATLRWPQRLRSAVVRVAIAGAFGDHHDSATSTGVIAATNGRVVEALRATGHAVTVLVDNAGTAEPTSPSSDRWPVRAVGRFVKPWDLDHIVAVLGAAPAHLATSALAQATPCHLWIHDDALLGVRFGANLQALEIARSVIVSSDEVVDAVRRATNRRCPVLVAPPDTSPPALASALSSWLADVDRLDPSTVRHIETPLASADP